LLPWTLGTMCQDRTLTNKYPDVLMAELKGNIQQHLLAAQQISLCADVWSKKGLTSFYMGTTAHFVGPKNHKWNHVTLAVRRFLHPHTGKHIREVVQEVLVEWNIPLAKVFAILTDNGSNMLKAFCSSLWNQRMTRMTRAAATRRRRVRRRRRKGTRRRTKMWRRVPCRWS